MRAASQRVGLHATGDAAIRRATSFYESAAFDAANDRFDADEALEERIDSAITDADYVAAVGELGLELVVEARARDIVAERLRRGDGPPVDPLDDGVDGEGSDLCTR